MRSRTSRSGLVRRVRRRSRVDGRQGFDVSVGEVEGFAGAVEALDGAAVELGEQGVVVG